MSLLQKIKNACKYTAGFASEIMFNPALTCSICRCDVFDERVFCEDCLKTLPYNNVCVCTKCGRKSKGNFEVCFTCKSDMPFYKEAKSAFVYDEPVSSLIKRLKYDNDKYIGDELAYFMAEAYIKYFFASDFLIPVPLHEKALNARGYNQALLLAEGVGKRLNVPVLDGVLIKHKESQRQATLDKKERIENLKNTFKVVDKKLIKGKDITVIDDVLTTGSTVNEITRVLYAAGAGEVKVLTAASVPDIKI